VLEATAAESPKVVSAQRAEIELLGVGAGVSHWIRHRERQIDTNFAAPFEALYGFQILQRFLSIRWDPWNCGTSWFWIFCVRVPQIQRCKHCDLPSAFGFGHYCRSSW
jgi:hypothetical protein